MLVRPKKDLIEVFGYAPDNTSPAVRSLWNLGACPFINKECTKKNHDSSITYGTCTVTTPYGNCVICPNRLYEDDYAVLKRVSEEAYGDDIPFVLYDEYIRERMNLDSCVVALGKNSGKEVQIGNKLSMDWVLAKISNYKLVDYTGIEVQSIDITGNYRDCWHSYKNISNHTTEISSSGHGMNWANVHKRLIPQIIRKSNIYSRSKYVSNGLYFIVPEIVYLKFEEIIGSDIPLLEGSGSDMITVHTYGLSEEQQNGMRKIVPARSLRFSLSEFSNRFISDRNLPSSEDLDSSVLRTLGLS